MAHDDSALPKALADFVFDLFDSVTLSQQTEEQTKLYETDFRELSNKYAHEPWPSPQAIASECNGQPLFLALYREMTHRHSVARPSIRDRMEGWQVYRELFDEILDQETNFYLIPSWVFDILHEFVYQFQGFCQTRSSVFASARKNGLLNADGTLREGGAGNAPLSLVENMTVLRNATDTWDAESVYSYLERLGSLPETSPVAYHFKTFGAIALSRLECLMGKFDKSLEALDRIPPAATIIPQEEGITVEESLQQVFAARLSMNYHAGVGYLMMRRYKDAIACLSEIALVMLRGFKTGQLRKLPGSEQFSKQYDRIMSLLAILNYICPGNLDDALAKVVREKFGSNLDGATSLEDWFACPKFISTDPMEASQRQQVQLFNDEMSHMVGYLQTRSFLKLYSKISLEKLAGLHELASVDEMLSLLMSYKDHMNQPKRTGASWSQGAKESALDVSFDIADGMVTVSAAKKEYRFETYFRSQIEQAIEIGREAAKIDTVV